jgi:hypothetical protein
MSAKYAQVFFFLPPIPIHPRLGGRPAKESRSIVHFARTRDVNLHLPVTFPTSSLAA